MATLEQVQSAFLQADDAGSTEDAQFFADTIRQMQTEAGPVNDPNEAGVENIPGVGIPARILAQPFYEGAVTANVILGAPEFVGTGTTQLYQTYDLLTSDKEKNKFKTSATTQANKLAIQIRELQASNQPIPPELSKTFLELDTMSEEGMTWDDASQLAKMRTDKIVEEYLTKGAIADGVVDYVLDTNIPESADKAKIKTTIEDFKKTIAENEFIPSEATLMDETILGNALQAFGWLIKQGAGALESAGVPKDNAQSIAEILSLGLGPKFAKTVKRFKYNTGYTDAVNKVYGDMLGGVLAKSDKLKAETAISKLETQLDTAKKELPDAAQKSTRQATPEQIQKVTDLELIVNQAKETLNTSEYNFLGGSKNAYRPDFSEFTLSDLAEYQKDGLGGILSPQGKIKTESRGLVNDVESLTKFEELTYYVANAARKVDQTTGINIINRVQNTFGKKNGFGSKRTMSDKTIEQYNQVVDVMEGTAPKALKLTKEQKDLQNTFKKIMREDVALTRYLQREGKIAKDIQVQEVYFPRKFVKEQPTTAQNIFGDKFKINLGDRAPREIASTTDRVYYKLENQGKPIYITISEAMNANPKTGKPGVPMVAVNFRTPNGKKVQVKANEKGSFEQQLAHELSELTKNYNEGQGLKRSGETIPAISQALAQRFGVRGTLKVAEVTRKEFAEVYPREQITDPLAALIQSVNEKRQLARQIVYEKDLALSAFGKRNIQIAEGLEKGIDRAYDPLKPTKNIAQTSSELYANQGKDVNPRQLTSAKIDLNEAGLPKLADKKLSRRVAGIIEDSFRPYEKTLVSKISDSLVKNMMLNPIPHMHNELIHYYSTKGLMGTWNPKQMKSFAADQAWAMDTVLNRTPEYIQMLRDGRSQMSVNVINTKALDRVLQQSTKAFLGDNVTKKWYNNLSKGLNKASKGYAAISDFAQYSMWTVRDVMYMGLVKQKMRTNKVSLNEAAKLVELHMPTYRLPTTVGPEALLGFNVTRVLSRVLQNPSIVIFARYKHGMISSGINTVKDITSGLDPALSRLGKAGEKVTKTLGYKNIQLGRSKSKQFTEGLDSGMALASAWFLFYPMMDALYEEIFDGDVVKARRAGILHVLETAAGVQSQQKDIQQMRQVLLTINPAFLLMYELMMNETIYNGQEIYNVNDLWGSGDIKQFGKDVGTKLLQAVPQVSTVINSTDDYDEFDIDKAVGRQFDAKIQTRKQSYKKAQRKAQTDMKNLTKAMEGGYVDDYLREYYETEPYYAEE